MRAPGLLRIGGREAKQQAANSKQQAGSPTPTGGTWLRVTDLVSADCGSHGIDPL